MLCVFVLEQFSYLFEKFSFLLKEPMVLKELSELGGGAILVFENLQHFFQFSPP